MAFFSLKKLTITIHLAKKAQIALLLAKKVKIPVEYLDFANIFSKQKPIVLPEQTDFNAHFIKLKNSRQPLYGPIYSLGLMKLETLKIYIKIYLKTGFI